MFVVVTGKDLEAKGFRRYLYNGQTVVSEPKPTFLGEVAVVHSEDVSYAGYLRDRLSSGLFGARLCNTQEEAETYIANELM